MPAKVAPLLLLAFALTACGSAKPTHADPKALAAAVNRVAYKTQLVDTHGIEVAVPARWRLNQGHCGTPKENTVLWNEDGILDCFTSQPPGLSVVEFGGFLGRSVGWLQRHAKHVTIDGAEALRYRRGNEVELYFQHRGMSMTVQSPHRALLRQILASVRIVKVNTDGCPTRPHPSYRVGSPPRAGQRFVPAGATGLVGCYYEAGWLDRSNRVGSGAAQRVAKVLNHASWGSSHAPRGSIAISECAPSWNSFSIAYFEYAHRPPVAVTAHLDGCTHLGASNGQWGVRMSYAWVPTFWNNVTYYGSVADVWGWDC